MNPVSRAPVRCTRCQASGELPRLVIPIKIVAASDLTPTPDMAFLRLAVMLTEHTDDGRVIVRGVTDAGLGLVAAMPAARFAEIAHTEFVESGMGWSP